MYKVNKTIALNESNVKLSDAHATAPKNIEYEKEIRAKAQNFSAPTQQSIFNLVKVADAHSKYYTELWDTISSETAPTSLFTALRAAWSERKN